MSIAGRSRFVVYCEPALEDNKRKSAAEAEAFGGNPR